MPNVAVVVQIGHGRLEAALQVTLVVLKQPEGKAPHQSTEPGEGI